MKNLQQEKQDLAKKQEKERVELEQKHAIQEAVLNILNNSPVVVPLKFSTHVYSLYGTVGSVSFNDLTKDQIVRLLKAFDGVQKINYVKSRDCFKQLRVIPETYADEDAKKNTRIVDGVPVEPSNENLGNYRIEVNRIVYPAYSQDKTYFKLKFLVNLEGIGLITVSLESSDIENLVSLNVTMSSQHGGGRYVESDRLEIHNGRLRSWSYTRWASGGREYAHSYDLIAPYEYSLDEITEVFEEVQN